MVKDPAKHLPATDAGTFEDVMTGFDDEENFYHEDYVWGRNNQPGWGHPPMFFPNRAGDPSPAEQAANVAASLLHGAVEGIGGIPIVSKNVGDLLDVDLADSLAQLCGLDPPMLRAGLMLLRSEGYRLVKVWRLHDEDGWDEGRDEIWPNPAPADENED